MAAAAELMPFLPTVMRTAARRFGDRPAFVDPDGARTSYAALDHLSDEVAAGMARAGVVDGSVVGLTLPSDTAYVVAYVAAAKLGAATAGVNPRLSTAEQERCLQVAEPDLVLASADDVRRLAVRGCRPAELRSDASRPVALVFTSGTTGLPKGAWFTDRQFVAVTRMDVDDAWGDPEAAATPMLAGTQFAHVGFMTKLPWYLRLGTTTHLVARWRAGTALDVIERERIPSVGGVAPQVALMLRDPSFDERDLSHVSTIVMGGGPSSPALVTEARQRFGAAYSIRYSSTESGGIGTGTAFDADDSEALHTVGRPRRDIALSIRDDEGRPVAAGEVGEVWLRSPATMVGYWHDPAATAAAMTEGWLHTGDLGLIDPGGCLVLAGRRSEMYVRGGYNVFPSEVEAVLGGHPDVDAVTIVAKPDDVMGEIGVAVIVPRAAARSKSSPLTLRDLRAFGADRLASYKLPDAIMEIDELPLTPMQKVDRRRLSDLVSDRPGRTEMS